MLFDCIVIGKGLIGSAAAKYLSESKKNIAILGPDEPSDKDVAAVYASHYDQARIQRIIGTDSIWTMLNLQSARQYDYLQKETGIHFYETVGCLYVNPVAKDIYLQQVQIQSEQFDLACNFFENNKALKKSFPDFQFPETAYGMFEPAPSGYINPRLLLAAQLSIFKKNNGTIIIDIANEIKYHSGVYKISTLNGKTYHAKKVLLAPGSFVNFLNLTNKKLALTLKSETIILAKLDERKAKRLLKLPSLLYEIETPQFQNIYLIGPVQYPDGHYYIKMGCNLAEDISFTRLEDVQYWFKNGNSDASKLNLKEALLTIMPKLKAQKFITRRCIISRTVHGKEYIGNIDNDSLFVATGCNGYSAMCSDALGRITATVVTQGIFPEEYPQKVFQPVFLD